jgi:cyanophycinase
MEPVDRALLQGRPQRAAFLPTAAALEGDARVAYWLDLGRQHYERLGVEPVPVPVRTRQDADDPDMAAKVAGVGLVYLSGGDPHHLAATLRGTLVWSAIVEAWHAGAALAGCSAGAMALTAGAPAGVGTAQRHVSTDGAAADGNAGGDGQANGLGLVPGIAVVPHFDMIERYRPGAVERFRAWQPEDSVLLGIEEETALLGDGASWRVEGRGAVWVLEAAGQRPVRSGEELALSSGRPR